MKRLLSIFSAVALAFTASAQTAQLKPEVFDLINLDHKGLEKVKSLHVEGKEAEAASALLDYFKARTGICTPDIRDVKKVKVTREQQQCHCSHDYEVIFHFSKLHSELVYKDWTDRKSCPNRVSIIKICITIINNLTTRESDNRIIIINNTENSWILKMR